MRQMILKAVVLLVSLALSFTIVAAQEVELDGALVYRWAPGYTPFQIEMSESHDAVELQGALIYRFAPGYTPFSVSTSELVQQPDTIVWQDVLGYRFAPGYSPADLFMGEIVGLPAS
jgi:hypothetical protein